MQFARETSKQIIADYVTQNKVRLVYRYFPVLGDKSFQAAVAAEAAAQQGAFWPYHDRLYDILATQGNGAFGDLTFRTIAADLKLDTAAFDKSYKDPATAAKVRAELDDGRRQGVQRTPTMFINGRKVEGALPYATFKSLIDDSLKQPK
ncbi:MAG: DsbA family protein [Chloroflexota bacterium]